MLMLQSLIQVPNPCRWRYSVIEETLGNTRCPCTVEGWQITTLCGFLQSKQYCKKKKDLYPLQYIDDRLGSARTQTISC